MTLREVQAGGGGAAGALLRPALTLLSGGFWLGTKVAALGRALGLPRVARLPVPVVSVGNLVAGGTGKTPFVAWLAARLLADGRRPGILARGYGAPAAEGGLSDEGAVLRQLLGDGVPQVEEADRRRGGERLLRERPDLDVVLLDDGFQHRRLHRDVDLVLLDATCPFGFGHLLPRGLLREPPSALGRASAVVVTRSDLGPVPDVSRWTAAPVVTTRLVPRGSLRGRRVFAASAIGNPDAYRRTIEAAGGEVVGRSSLPDHAPLPEAVWEGWARDAKAARADLVVVTRKDAVKRRGLPDGFEILDVDLEVTSGEEALLGLLSGLPFTRR
jgi:tetraacyldisaccharide 4'-kinase